MDRVEQYRETLHRLMVEHERLGRPGSSAGVESILLANPCLDQFILMDLGWDESGRVNYTYLHARIKDRKIWVEEDWTEEGLANELVDAGVPKEDIVLAFQPPGRRHLTKYAVA